MGLIVKLPLSKEPMTRVVYDSILVITDRLTKYGHFVPYKEASNAEELAYIFKKIVIADHGLPDEIISEQGQIVHLKVLAITHGSAGNKSQAINSFSCPD